MPTSPSSSRVKWYPGHYVLESGDNKIDQILAQIAGTTSSTNIPNLRGVQKRFSWRQMESERDGYDFSKVIEALDKCKAASAASGHDRFLRILLMYKGIGGRGAPDYLRPGNPGYESAFGIGTYQWGNAADEEKKNEHPAFWIPAVEERFKIFLGKLGEALDSIGQPPTDSRYWLAAVDFNETAWGKNGTTELTPTQRTDQAAALRRLQTKLRDSFPTTLVGQFVNFPANGSFNILNELCPHMLDIGITLGGPDTWRHDTTTENGVYLRYPDAHGKTAISPSVQNQNYNHDNHHDATSDPVVYNDEWIGGPTGLLPPYNRVTTVAQMIEGVMRQGLRGTHVTWHATPSKIYRPTDSTGAPTGPVPWTVVKNFFKNKWDEGPDAGVLNPGVITTVPEKLLVTGAPPPPPPPPPPPGTLTLTLETDTGPSTTDLITSNGTVKLNGTTTGATVQYATAASGPWTTTQPAAIEGTNTRYARQVVSGTPGTSIGPLTFTFDNTAPTLESATVDGNALLLAYASAVNLSNVTGFKPSLSNYVVKNGSTTIAVTGTFVNEGAKRIRLDLGTTMTGPESLTVSYTQPTTGTARLQDFAGNYAANLVNEPVTNLTGVPTPTAVVVITSASGRASDGFTNDTTPDLAGTLSIALAGSEVLEMQRAAGTGAFATIGLATVAGTNWTFADAAAPLAEGAYKYRGRVRVSDRFGPNSAEFAINIDTTEPTAPTASSVTVGYGEPITITGSWGNEPGAVLSVSIAATTYTTANGITITGTNWVLAIPSMPSGTYSISARVTDPAGNVALDETPAELVVRARASINHARLAKARRRH